MPYRKKEIWLKPLYIRLKNMPWKGIIFILFSIFLLFATVRSWIDGYASINWKVTSGKITTSKAIICHRKYSLSTDYQAVIVYSYVVNGVPYSSSQISFTSDQFAGLGCGSAEKAMEMYPLGSSVSVHYNPQNPKDSVLIPGGTNFMILGFSLVSGYFGVVELKNNKSTRTKRLKQVR